MFQKYFSPTSIIRKFFKLLYTTNYKPTIEQHWWFDDDWKHFDSTFLRLCAKYDCMNDYYFLCLIDLAFTF
jgi:hypothetical protein